MLGIKRVVIGDGERGLLYKNRRFERVLAPGVYRLWDGFGATEVRVVDIVRPDFVGKDTDALIGRLGADLSLSFVLADVGVMEVGLVSKNGKLDEVLAPGTRKLYWKGPGDGDRRQGALGRQLAGAGSHAHASAAARRLGGGRAGGDGAHRVGGTAVYRWQAGA